MHGDVVRRDQGGVGDVQRQVEDYVLRRCDDLHGKDYTSELSEF